MAVNDPLAVSDSLAAGLPPPVEQQAESAAEPQGQ